MKFVRHSIVMPLLAIAIAGCSPIGEHFPPNRVYALKMEREAGTLDAEKVQAIQGVLEELLGTPNEPRWPLESRDAQAPTEERSVETSSGRATESLLNPSELSRVAGAVRSDKAGVHYGLFREHCAGCHGLAGNGAGPTASFMNPYPRDFRAGIFKYKLTERGAKPTREDLERSIHEGMRGSSMPSFALLPPEDIRAIAEYVIYLSVRGEVERRMLWDVAMDEAPGSREDALAVFHEVVEDWTKSRDRVISIAAAIPESASAERGEAIFKGPLANCVACHGADGKGNVALRDFDEWTKEWTSRAGIDPLDTAATKPFRKAGALPPRIAMPRDLTVGAFHGGGRPIDLYHRITQGIEGTPMPAVIVEEKPSKVALTESQVWDLIQYVYQLSGISPLP